MLSTAALRVLDARDAEAVTRPARARPAGQRLRRLAGRPSGSTRGGSAGSCGVGRSTAGSRRCATPAPTWSPSTAGHDALAAFAERARRQGRRCSSIVGPVDDGRAVVGAARAGLGAGARRPVAPAVHGDRRRTAGRARPGWFAGCAPTSSSCCCRRAIAMFTEEVGVSPLGQRRRRALPGRVADLVAAGRAFARIEDGRVVFKAEIGAVTAGVPGAGRVGRPGPAWPGAGRTRHRGRRGPCARPSTRRRSPCTSTTSTGSPAGSTAGSASPRSPPSRPSSSSRNGEVHPCSIRGELPRWVRGA